MWWKRKEPRQWHEPTADTTGSGIFHTGVGDECEAYLAGQLAMFFETKRRPVPPVAWLNQIVHGTTNELAILAVGITDVFEPCNWRRAVSYLARSLLERARETGRPVEELQWDLLLPLELDLLGNHDKLDLDPADLIRMTMARIYELPELPA